jgi:hypothetical protein
VIAAAILVAVAAAFVVLRSLTMYVPDPPRPGERVMTVTLSDRRIEAPVVATTEVMTNYCIAATGAPIDRASVVGIGGAGARILLSPRLDASTQRRLNGCLEDAILDRRSMHIDSIVDRLP